MSSTESSPESAEASEATKDQEALREAYETAEGIRRLGRMCGVKSLKRNLEAEDEAARRNTEACEREMFGGSYEASAPAESDDMIEEMAARDIQHITNNYYGASPDSSPPPAQTSTPINEAPAASVEPSAEPASAPQGGLSTLAKAAVLGSAIVGSSGLTAIAMNVFGSDPAPVAEQGDPNKYSIDHDVTQTK